ncbi:MAG TPA: protein kinase family protein [Ornithinibacter sp.]|nr:protein kinase family protein [Ornithinibacter sp.]
MRGVGPGTVLGGRYTVRRRLEQLHDTERWSADDTTLGRSVSLLCIAGDDHRTPALLDGARRAASVNHGVFVRILDVGSDEGVAYVVEEDLGEARTLAELVTDGGVPGDEVRRISGEVAAALESAGQRGMHHLDLKPDDVLRTPDGDVRLRGLETASVRAGEDGTEAEDAARRDAVGVVALTYAGLTGLWPLGAGGSGLAPAPRVPGGVAAPSEIAAGVPRDLDAICRLTLNDDQGPTSPGDFARQVAPWPSRQVVGRPITRTVPAATLDDTDAAAVADAANGPDAANGAVETPDTLEQPLVPGLQAEPTAELGAAAASADAASTRPRKRPLGRKGAAAAGVVGGAALASGAGAASAAGTASGTAATGAGAATGGVSNVFDVEADEATRVIQVEDQTPDWLRATPTASAAVPAAPPPDLDEHRDVRNGELDETPSHAGAAAAGAGAGAAVAGALGSVGGRVGNLARRAVDKVSELSPDTAPRPDQGDLEAPAPLVPAEPLTKDESKLALGIVVGFVVLALIIGIYGVSRIGSGSDSPGGVAAPATRTTTVAPSSAAPTGSGSPTGAQTGAPPEPLAILKVEAYDPEGDGAENNNLTPKVYDGDKSTGWFSENYRSDTFGGLKKGVGVIVDLGPNKKPQTVELDIPHPSDVEVYVGPDNRLEGATKIGEKADADGTVTFDVPADVSGQYIVVWFTKLNADDNGKRRAWLDEVVVTG